MRHTRWPALLMVTGALLGAQAPDSSQEPVRIGPGITPPRVTHKIEPEYSPEARGAHVQGTVVLQLIVYENGRAGAITAISPLGYGLDEQAEQAVAKWEFAPGMKDGQPVKVFATVEVNFRLLSNHFDEKAEHQRTLYNESLQTLKQAVSKQPAPATPAVEAAVKKMRDLAGQHFPPALFVAGLWDLNGTQGATKDPQRGLGQLQKAAARNYGPAMYELAIRQIKGLDLPADPEKGLAAMHKAAQWGSPQAQYYLGEFYAKGAEAPADLGQARKYLRLCAAQSVPQCQFGLGRLLLDTPDRKESDYVQAVAWLQLAGEHGMAEAQQLAFTEASAMTPSQSKWMLTLKKQLERK